jgi:putative phosphoesterase
VAAARGVSGVTIGVISDTHGLLRPQAVAQLQGSEFIVHAGDIGTPDMLATLARIAPVTAVRGNNDRGGWAEALPHSDVLDARGTLVYVVHDLAEIDVDPAAAGFHVVVSGHSHRPSCTTRDGVLFLNPGSAGPRRFTLPIAVARLTVRDARVSAQVIELDL